jgi:hypothetical protein
VAKSLLYQEGETTLVVPPGCEIGERTEVPVSIRYKGRIYRAVLRDKVVVEDPLVVLVKASAFAIREGEPYQGQEVKRNVKDFLIKQNVVV